MQDVRDVRRGGKPPGPSPMVQFLGLVVVALISATVGVLIYVWMAGEAGRAEVGSTEVVAPEGAPVVPAAAAFKPTRTPQRSPMLAAGERLDAPIPFGRLAVEEPPAIPAGQPVPWSQARYFVGKTVTVEGRIVDTNNIGKLCFLNFSKQWRDEFYVVVFDSAFKAWPQPPERHFLDKLVRVTGEVTLHQGRPQVQVHEAGQIVIVE